ncbi:MAG: hypothetical protein EPN38_09400 [Rhodanobacteraceae bacterium]|nr:MAG: hypothetical protein EPN38_09400 [Rhodanobacteraceae bacterium]
MIDNEKRLIEILRGLWDEYEELLDGRYWVEGEPTRLRLARETLEAHGEKGMKPAVSHRIQFPPMEHKL